MNTSRRDFLKLSTNTFLALAGALGIGGLFRFLGYQFDKPTQIEFDIGPADNYLYNTRTVISYIPAMIVHDASGFHAISMECTHLGCTIEARNFGFECPCHGSRFDINGNNARGPAVIPLKKLRVEKMEDGHLRIYKV